MFNFKDRTYHGMTDLSSLPIKINIYIAFLKFIQEYSNLIKMKYKYYKSRMIYTYAHQKL